MEYSIIEKRGRLRNIRLGEIEKDMKIVGKSWGEKDRKAWKDAGNDLCPSVS